MRVYYLPLEPYRERYTELLTNWTERRFRSRDIAFKTVYGQRLGEGINVGQVLDAHGRSYWSTTQIAALVREMQGESDLSDAVIYLDDMFTPGYAALPYIVRQMPESRRPRIYARNFAQSVDPDDFTFPMRDWMRPYEEMLYATASGVICASTIHRELMEIARLPTHHVHVLGLPYDEVDVRARLVGSLKAHGDRPRRVVYASRLDREKQPWFFLDVVDAVHRTMPEVEFVVCTGSTNPRSNDPESLMRLRQYAECGRIRLAAGLTKADYYRIVADSRVQLNTARQDFISYTAIEASTFGTPTLAPAFRSFPECLRNRASQLYAPWSVEEASEKLKRLLVDGDDPAEVSVLSANQHASLDRIISLFQIQGTA